MRDLELISPLNALNLNVSSAKTSHRVTFLVGGSGIDNVLWVFSLISFYEKPRRRSISSYGVDVENWLGTCGNEDR
jgi:hypothetical protein